jgi:hypothetical protein
MKNMLHPDDKYFDLLANLPWDSDNMILINVTEKSHKKGAIYATKIPVDKSLKNNRQQKWIKKWTGTGF